MHYPGTVDNWYDHSGVKARETVEVAPRPLMLTAAAFDRGPEKITRVHGQDFYKLYGYFIDFEKYGQAAIQAANIIDNGGELLIKRVVANDATLANVVVVANVASDRVQKTDEYGQPLYLDPVTQQETTDPGENNEAVMISVAKIKYDLVTVTGKKTMAEIVEEAKKSFTESDTTSSYPLFVITDIGRGESCKRFGFIAQHNISKNLNFMIYKMKYLGSENLDAEEVYFTVDPEVMYLGKSMSIEMASAEMIQCNAKAFGPYVEAFYTKLVEISGISREEMNKIDVLFARNAKGEPVQGISLDPDGQDLSVGMGFSLQSGSNGEFGQVPIDTDAYEKALIEFFDGTFDSDIYNLDMYKPDVCIDANYPFAVKVAITELAKFRKDFFFIGDFGLDISTFENAVVKNFDMPKDKFTAWYAQNYEIVNPFTKRNIRVTITYSIARMVIDHLNTRRNAAYCGILFGWTIPEAIEGTINFTPKIVPKINQKVELDERKINYASVLNNVLTLETEYTSQEAYTQLSFMNNVIAIQKIIKDIRDNCPKYRYSFVTTDDLRGYKKSVSSIINKYKNWFEILEFVYVQDEIMKANKVFEADIRVKHKDFIQAEIMNIYTLGNEQAAKAGSDTGFIF